VGDLLRWGTWCGGAHGAAHGRWEICCGGAHGAVGHMVQHMVVGRSAAVGHMVRRTVSTVGGRSAVSGPSALCVQAF